MLKLCATEYGNRSRPTSTLQNGSQHGKLNVDKSFASRERLRTPPHLSKRCFRAVIKIRKKTKWFLDSPVI